MLPEIHETGLAQHASGPEVARVLRAYAAVSGESGMPVLRDLLGALDPDLHHHVEIVACEPDGWRYVQYGSALMAACGFDMTGRRVGEFLPAMAEIYTALIARLRASGRPLLAIDRYPHPGSALFWERLLLPCRSTDGHERIVAFVRPRGGREDLLGAVFEAAQDGVLVLRAVRDAAGKLVDATVMTCNPTAARLLGLAPDAPEGASILSLFAPRIGREIWRRCQHVIEKREVDRCEIDLSRHGMQHGHEADGAHEAASWLRMSIAPLADGVVVSFVDVSDLRNALIAAERAQAALSAEIARRQRLEDELRRLSLTDELTGLANRRAFLRHLRQEIRRMRRHGDPLAVIAVDLDHFKAINDAHGHPAGDALLIGIAALFHDATRRDLDVVARIGGEEFMLILPRTGREEACLIAERLRTELAERRWPIAETELRVTGSFGVIAFDDHADPRSLIVQADAALYRAKRAGRNRVVVCDGPDATSQASMD
jgi:diguanylate cyclase (GGDEF)-like protein